MAKASSLVTFALLIAIASSGVEALPEFAPGNLQLRHDLQLLSDAGILNIPVTTWPIALGSVAYALGHSSRERESLTTAELAALQRVESIVQQESRDGVRTDLTASLADNDRLPTFGNPEREDAQAMAGLSWTSAQLALRLQVATVADPKDDRQYRLDGSYAALLLGNWMLTAGMQDRWWGPGWEGSLILSSNARPVPGFSLQRNRTEPIDNIFLRWLGPWTITFFGGQLEESREIPHAKLLGARFVFKPLQSLELGLSRTAQWGGKGRPESLDSFGDLVFGRDNTGQAGISAQNEPGNQLGGFDARWVLPSFLRHSALYAQKIGEDEAGYRPSRYTSLAGLELWGEWGDSSWRVHTEYADTKAYIFNYAYNHGIYTDGYRYHGRSLGHAMDNDGRSISLGGLWLNPDGGGWDMTLRHIELNRDGGGLNTVSSGKTIVNNLELTRRYHWSTQDLAIGALLESREPEGASKDYDAHVFLQWRINFGNAPSR